MTPSTKNGKSGLQWWIMSAMWAVMLAGGGGWAANINSRLASLEGFVKEKTPEMRRTAIVDHEARLHRESTITVREVEDIKRRLDRIETKIDDLKKR